MNGPRHRTVTLGALALCTGLGLGGTGIAQLPPDHWAVETWYDHVLLDSSFRGVAVNGWRLGAYDETVDARGRLFAGGFGIASSKVGRYDFDPVAGTWGPLQIVADFSPATLGVIKGSAVIRDRLYAMRGNGELAVASSNGTNQSFTVLGDVWNIPAFAQAVQQGSIVDDMCSNGRDAFFSVTLDSRSTHHVFAVDMRSSPFEVRPLASVLGNNVRGPTLAMARDGDVLAMTWSGLWRIHPWGGGATFVEAAPTTMGTHGFTLAYDPWSDTVVTGPVPKSDATIIYGRKLTGGSCWTLRYSIPFLSGLYSVASTSEQPFELFGKGCPNATGNDPRMGWAGLPRQGGSFSLTLRRAEPNGTAIFWLGLSDQHWPGIGALPWDAGSLGGLSLAMSTRPHAAGLTPVRRLR